MRVIARLRIPNRLLARILRGEAVATKGLPPDLKIIGGNGYVEIKATSVEFAGSSGRLVLVAASSRAARGEPDASSSGQRRSRRGNESSGQGRIAEAVDARTADSVLSTVAPAPILRTEKHRRDRGNSGLTSEKPGPIVDPSWRAAARLEDRSDRAYHGSAAPRELAPGVSGDTDRTSLVVEGSIWRRGTQRVRVERVDERINLRSRGGKVVNVYVRELGEKGRKRIIPLALFLSTSQLELDDSAEASL